MINIKLHTLNNPGLTLIEAVEDGQVLSSLVTAYVTDDKIASVRAAAEIERDRRIVAENRARRVAAEEREKTRIAAMLAAEEVFCARAILDYPPPWPSVPTMLPPKTSKPPELQPRVTIERRIERIYVHIEWSQNEPVLWNNEEHHATSKTVSAYHSTWTDALVWLGNEIVAGPR